MEKRITFIELPPSKFTKGGLLKRIIVFAVVLLLSLPCYKGWANTYTSSTNGNWGSSATWGGAGVPGINDNVIIHGNTTVTIDGTDSCNNLTIGDATNNATTLQITASGKSLYIKGALSINPSSINQAITLNAGPGTIKVAGTFPTWCSTQGTNSIQVSTGTITFTPAITISTNKQNITYSGAGTINFNGAFTDNINGLVTATNCIGNFGGSYTINTTNETWAGKGTANFTSNSTITANMNLTFYNLQVAGSVTTTLASAAGTTIIAGTATLASSSAFTANKSFELDGNWTNNGGTLTATGDTVFLNANGATISGTGTTSFPVLQLGTASSAKVSYSMNNTNSCTALVFYSTNQSDTLKLGSSGVLNVSGNVTVNQPTNPNTNMLAVNGGTCNITGNLSLPGTATTGNWIASVNVTSGTLTVTGNTTFGNNSHAANAVITVSTGTINFSSSMTMASGTLSATGAGTINFNGSSAPSFAFGGANAPAFTTVSGSNINFSKGFTNNTNALTFNAGSNSTFLNTGTVTPNAAITFGNVQLDSSVTGTIGTGSTVIVGGSLTLLYNSIIAPNHTLEVDGNWVNNGGTISATDEIIMNGAGQTIGGTNSTTFPILQMGVAGNNTTLSCTVNTDITVDSLIFSAANNARTLNIGSAITVTVAGNVNMNQPTGIAINELAVNAGTCTISGNLKFIGGNNAANQIAEVLVTSGSFTVSGAVNLWSSNSTANQVITVSTGTITFAQSLTMGASTGTLSVTGTGTVNFNGTTAPSFNFGGSPANKAPVFTAASGSSLYFATGFTNNSNALTLNAASNAYFTGSGSITPSAAITFGNVYINASAVDTLVSGGAVIIAGSFSLASGSSFLAKEDMEVDGNWSNTSATFTGTGHTVYLNGAAQTVSGSATTFPTLEIGNSTTSVNAATTMACSNSCAGLIFQAGAKGRSLTLNSGTTLTVSGNLTINQETVNNMVAIFTVGAGTCTVSGNLTFSGNNNGVTRISQIAVTSGTFTLSGTITWGGCTPNTCNVISVTTGSAVFQSSVTMGGKTGTIKVTGSGSLYFNGSSAPSLNFGGSPNAPSFTAASGSYVYFAKGLTATTAIALNDGSTATFAGTGTLTPTAAVSFGNVNIRSGATLTLAGSTSLLDNWIDSGTLVPSTYLVNFNGIGTQLINRTAGAETFYRMQANTAGAIIQMNNDVTVTDSLIMAGANINLNNHTLTLGNSAAATLNYIGGIAYGGTWKRWWPTAQIVDSTGALYGLFPLGTSTDYRYIKINSTSNPTTPGYVSATHTNVSGVTSVSYTDNGGSNIVAIGNMHSDLTTSLLAGGAYNIKVKFTGFSPTGNLSDIKLETYTSSVMGSVGTHISTAGPPNTPVMQRSGLTASQLNNAFVAGTNDKNASPLYAYYYSRKTGNWSDTSAWSYTSGGAGASCGCSPISGGYVVVNSPHTITCNNSDSIQYIDINDGGTLVNSSGKQLSASGNLYIYGTGKLTNNGTAVIAGALVLAGTGATTASGNVTVYSGLILMSGGSYSQTAGTLNLNDELIDSGTITINPSATLTISGSGTPISGSGSILDSTGTITLSSNKSIVAGSTITFGTSTGNLTLNIASAATISNAGNVILYGSMTGGSGTATWLNNAPGSLSVTGALLSTGLLNASTQTNTVNYNGTGSQTIKDASANSYYNLTISNSGTKTPAADIQIDNAMTISGSATLDETTFILSGAASLTMTGTSQLKLQRSIEDVYPELTGAYTLTGGTVTVNQTAVDAILAPATYYNLTLNGTTPYDISGISNINNNLYVQNSATFSNTNALTVGGTFTDTSSGTLTLYDNLTAYGIALKMGTLNDDSNIVTISGAGGWTMSGGSFTTTGQTVFYNKTGVAQNIGGSSATTFNDLTINNPGNVTLNVSPAATTVVNDNLNLTTGNLITTSTNLLKLAANAGVTNGSALSYVSGPMDKVIGTTGSFIYPVGNNGVYGQVGVSGIVDATTEVTAQYYNASYSSITPVVAPLVQVSHTEYWNLSRAVTADSMQLQLFWTNATNSDLIDCSYLTAAYYNGSQWINEAATPVAGSSCAGSDTGSILTNGFVNSMGPFTFGGSGGDALPVELTKFTAVPVNNEFIHLDWATAIEINNNGFEVERSTDGSNWANLAWINGHNNSTVTNNYNVDDYAVVPGVQYYYRLKQMDNNDAFKYSPVQSAMVNDNLVFVVSEFIPNPTNSTTRLIVNAKSAQQISVAIYNMTGLKLTEQTQSLNAGANQIKFDYGLLPSGTYSAILTTDSGTYSKKLVIIK